MSPRRTTAAAAALLLIGAGAAAAGCGLGAGPTVGEVSLTVTRDFGARRLLAERGEVRESDTVMRVLERNADLETRYGGGFVQAIDGLEAEQGGGGPHDWFYFVDGVEASVGAADYRLSGGEAVWWDYRNWSKAEHVPAVVGSWPHPFVGAYDGSPHPVAVECLGGGAACGEVRHRLAASGAHLGAAAPSGGALRVLVGPWARLRGDAAAAQIGRGPEASGVFVEAVGGGAGPGLEALDEEGRPARRLGPQAGLVAATRRYEDPPTWVVTGATEAGVRAAAGLLSAAGLRDRYAVAVEGGTEIPLPVR